MNLMCIRDFKLFTRVDKLFQTSVSPLLLALSLVVKKKKCLSQNAPALAINNETLYIRGTKSSFAI